MAKANAGGFTRAALMQARILWGSMTAASVAFLGVLIFLGQQAHREPQAVMLPALGLVALSMAVMSFVIPQRQHAQAVSKLSFDVVDEADPDASDVIPTRDAPTRRVVKKPLKVARKAFALYQVPLILSCAMSESVALFGFVLGFSGFPLPTVLPFFVVSWALLLLRFPTLSRVLAPVEAKLGARIPVGP